MRYSLSRALAWALMLIALATAPMLLAYTGPLPARRFWVEFGVGLGFVAVGLLVLQFVLSGRYRRVAPSFGLDSMLVFHRELGIVALVFILGHPVVLVVTDPGYLDFFDPRVNLLRALSLSGVTLASILIVASSLWRVSARLTYEWWRLIHGVLAALIILIAIVHPVQVGHYVSRTWIVALFGLLGAFAFALLVNTRVIRPWRMKRRPYRVEAVTAERGEASTLVLAPNGHEGMTFVPGQFAWVTLGDTPFTLQQHPYSFSSSADASPDHLCITIKEGGDFSAWARSIDAGRTAYLEGPYGAFVPPQSPEVGCVMIAGGVGITPMMSMLRTFAERKDPRNLVLIYANQELDDVIFFEALSALTERLDLRVVHVLEEPPDAWDGEEGLLDREMIERYVPEASDGHEYFICGPEPMMNIAEQALLEIGIKQNRILSERFNIV